MSDSKLSFPPREQLPYPQALRRLEASGWLPLPSLLPSISALSSQGPRLGLLTPQVEQPRASGPGGAATGLHSPLGPGGGGSSGCASARPTTAVAAARLPACSRPAPDRLRFTSTPSPAARAQCPALTRKQLSGDPQQQHVTLPHVSRPLRDWEGPGGDESLRGSCGCHSNREWWHPPRMDQNYTPTPPAACFSYRCTGGSNPRFKHLQDKRPWRKEPWTNLSKHTCNLGLTQLVSLLPVPDFTGLMYKMSCKISTLHIHLGVPDSLTFVLCPLQSRGT